MRSAVATTLALLLLVGCSASGRSSDGGEAAEERAPAPAPPAKPASASTARVILEPPGGPPVTVHVEVVRTPEETRRGLMYRKHLPGDAGMLFLMHRDAVHSFWMRNTLIPLDMIFIDRDKVVVGIVENTEPLTDTSRRVGKPSRYVLEVNGGFSAKHGIGAGTRVRFEGVKE